MHLFAYLIVPANTACSPRSFRAELSPSFPVPSWSSHAGRVVVDPRTAFSALCPLGGRQQSFKPFQFPRHGSPGLSLTWFYKPLVSPFWEGHAFNCTGWSAQAKSCTWGSPWSGALSSRPLMPTCQAGASASPTGPHGACAGFAVFVTSNRTLSFPLEA